MRERRPRIWPRSAHGNRAREGKSRTTGWLDERGGADFIRAVNDRYARNGKAFVRNDFLEFAKMHGSTERAKNRAGSLSTDPLFHD
jgi:hypothetical protein